MTSCRGRHAIGRNGNGERNDLPQRSMPASLPGMSATQAAAVLQKQDCIISSYPEVESVFGQAGRALTATDPAPLEMSETVNLKPESQCART